MAENKVEILVTSKNKSKAGMDEATADAEATGSRIAAIFDKMGSSVQKKLDEVSKNIRGNLAKGFGAIGGGSGLLAMAGPIGAAGVAMGAFGAIAIPILTKIATAHTQLAAAQLQYNKATTAAGRASALKAEEQATAGLTAQQKGLMGTVDGLKASWGNLQNQMTPVVVTVANLAVKLGTALMPALGALAQAGAGILAPFIEMLTTLVKSPFFTQFTATLQVIADQAGQVLGPALIGLLKVFMQLFIQTAPAGIQILTILLPLIVRLAADLVPVIAVMAKVVAAVLAWLQHTHLLLPVLALLAVAILALDAPIAAVVAAVAVLIAIGVELGKHWRQIWHGILAIVDSVFGWIRGHWPLLLSILTGPIGAAVIWIVTHWSTVTGIFSRVLGGIRGAWNAVYGALVSPIVSAAQAIAGWVSYIFGLIDSIPSRINSALGGIPGKILGALGLEHGGIVGAATGGVHGGLRMVGEHGRELVRLPVGSTVHSNPDTERIMAGAGGGVAKLQLEWVGGNAGDDFMKWLKKNVRVRGGDPSVLGR